MRTDKIDRSWGRQADKNKNNDNDTTTTKKNIKQTSETNKRTRASRIEEIQARQAGRQQVNVILAVRIPDNGKCIIKTHIGRPLSFHHVLSVFIICWLVVGSAFFLIKEIKYLS